MCAVPLEVQAEGVPCASQARDVARQLKALIQNHEQETRAMLWDNPRLAWALFVVQIRVMVADPKGKGGVPGQPQHVAEPHHEASLGVAVQGLCVLCWMYTRLCHMLTRAVVWHPETWRQQQHDHCMIFPEVLETEPVPVAAG